MKNNFILLALLLAMSSHIYNMTWVNDNLIRPITGHYEDHGIGEEARKKLPEVEVKLDRLGQELMQTKMDNVRLGVENKALTAAQTEAQRKLIELKGIAARDAFIVKGAAALAGTASTIYIALKIRDAYHWVKPSSDERAWREYAKSQSETRDQAARRALDFMKAEREFKPCIVDHAKSARRTDGIPLACSASADEYAKHIDVKEWSQFKSDYTEMFGAK